MLAGASTLAYGAPMAEGHSAWGRAATVAATAGLFAAMRLLPPPAGLPDAGWAVAALAAAMAVLWFTEALPIAVTALLPFLLLPLMGVGTADAVAATYWSPVLFLVLGGALFALAVERSGLHLRLALAIARAAPRGPRGLLVGMMLATAVLSMFVSNTATALVMMPVALGLVAAAGAPERGPLAQALVLGVAWSATIGGLGTLVGSPTNAISAGIIDRALDIRIDFLTWALFGVPLVLVAIPLVGLLLVVGLKVPPGGGAGAAAESLLRPAAPLGPDERRLLPLLGLLLAGWLLLPLVGPLLGWPRIDDGAVAIGCALLLFLVPSGRAHGGPLLDPAAVRRVPWDMLLLYGGGLALAAALTDSGLAAWIGRAPFLSAEVPLWLLALLLVTVIVAVTEFASNVATASGFMPVVAAVIADSGADPLTLVMPAALAASWGFMMPAGTGPNAIACGTGVVPVKRMIRLGFLADLVGIPLIVGVCLLVAALL